MTEVVSLLWCNYGAYFVSVRIGSFQIQTQIPSFQSREKATPSFQSLEKATFPKELSNVIFWRTRFPKKQWELSILEFIQEIRKKART